MIGRDRGEHYLVSINDHESQSRFMARCDTSEKFKTVHHVAVFDGCFFLSRDNGRAYWSRLPPLLATALVNAGRNNDGDVTCVAGSETYRGLLRRAERWRKKPKRFVVEHQRAHGRKHV